ncbi:hypothetical protein PIB30_055822 [Stylosanthes scabra]|uniref:LOB domain-containing protein n=1 Tax=Stylosanthes scabra TaxID=79078 RepID=A0ABU6WKX1_9FABA|nr:hypothetical protein [Stylosanthes scabra]
MSSTNSPCAACKFLRRKCTQECIFAPYFPPDNPQRFAYVHRVFGASNIGKILNELAASQREDAVKSLAFEAEARLRDPVYGCVGEIAVLQQRLRQAHTELLNAKNELSAFVNPQALQGALISPHGIRGVPLYPQAKPLSPTLFAAPYGQNTVPAVQHSVPLGAAGDLDPEQQELLEAQQLAAAAAIREQQHHAMMMRNFELQQQQEYLRYNAAAIGLEPAAVAASPASIVTAEGGGSGGSGSGVFGQMGGQAGEMAPCLALGTFDSSGTYNQHQHHHQMQQQAQQHGVGENYVGLATHHHHHHYPVEAQFLLSSEQQAQLSQQQQPSETYYERLMRERELEEASYRSWMNRKTQHLR